jgi:pimeloyl-ACP methyl ester carboxylesterase
VDTKAAPDTEEARAGRRTLADKVLQEGSTAAAEAMLPKLLGATSHRERPAVVAGVRAAISRTSPPGIANALLGLGARADSRPGLSAIRVPTLAVRGEEDAVITAADAEELRTRIPGCQAVTIPKSGHLPSLETPDELTKVLLPFVGSVQP